MKRSPANAAAQVAWKTERLETVVVVVQMKSGVPGRRTPEAGGLLKVQRWPAITAEPEREAFFTVQLSGISNY